jgi:hypothetical protein
LRGATDEELNEIREGLTASAEALSVAMLGQPASKVSGTWRWGRKGSLAVEVRGPRRGQWFDHEAGEGGDLLSLIRREQGGDFPSTVQWARNFLGVGEVGDWTPQKRQIRPEVEAARAKREAEAEAEKAERRGFAARLWQESQIAEGTPAAIYLAATRRITCPAPGWPASAVRFHAGRCALIVAATTDAGEVQAVQLVYLTPDGQKRVEEGKPTKQSFGPQEGAVVRLPGDRAALLTAEGPETGLTAWAATGRETWIALGSMSKIELPPLRQVVVVADDDPERPGHTMCDDLDAVREAQSVKANPEVTVCRGKAGTCPFFEVCGYQRQKQQQGDLWLVPHQIVFGAKPKAIPAPAILVVDEAAWTKGLEGVDGLPVDITLDTLAEPIEPHDSFNALSASRLRSVHSAVLRALEQQKDGPLRRDSLLVAGLNADTGRDGRALSYDRLKDAELQPGMSAEARRLAVHEVRSNRAAMRCARFFTALRALLDEGGPEASGWASLVTLETTEGPVRALRIRGRRDVGKQWLVPTLHLDALLNPDLLRPYWPQIQVTAEIEARSPHQRVRQLQGRDWPKSALVPDKYCEGQDGEAERRLKNSERLRSAIWREARRVWPGRVLVVAQKAVEDYWRSAGPMPGNVELAHHNAVAGRDEWGPGQDREGVVSLIVVGRTQPRPDAAERIAEALTGKASDKRCSRYDRRDAAIQMEDGTAISAEADCHPDPMAEAVRWQICEGELIQIIGRGRGVNRTSADPLQVTVLTDRPLPLEVAEAVSWDELAPNPEDLMLGQAGVAFEDAADASRAYPNLWPTGEAAKKAFQRARCGTNPIRELSIGECPAPLRQAKYQRKGPGKRPAVLVFDPKAVAHDELRGWLEDRLGELARLDIEEAPSPVPQPPAPQNRGAERVPPAENSVAEHAHRMPVLAQEGVEAASAVIWPSTSGEYSQNYVRTYDAEAKHAPPWPAVVVEQIEDRRSGGD